MTLFRRQITAATSLAILVCAGSVTPSFAQQQKSLAAEWVGAWGAAPTFPTGPEVNNRTVRQIVRLSTGGSALRIRISNELGAAPLVIGAAHIAEPGPELGSIVPKTDRVLTFDGRPSVTILPGAPILSDPVPIATKPLNTLSVSLFVPQGTGPTSTHPLGQATAYIVDGDATGASILAHPSTSAVRFFISGVEVRSQGGSTVVVLGDSITDGFGSTANTNRRWPDVLAERLTKAGSRLSVVNAGIGGNRVLHDKPQTEFGPAAIARFDRDVLAVPGVQTVIVMEGINDIGQPESVHLVGQSVRAEDIIAGLRQLVDRAHGHGLRMLGATLTPFADAALPGYFSPAGEATRQAVNRFIRTSGTFDGVVDFDAAVRDPARSDHLKLEYDSGDHLHPNDAGYRRMGEAVDLKILSAAKSAGK